MGFIEERQPEEKAKNTTMKQARGDESLEVSLLAARFSATSRSEFGPDHGNCPRPDWAAVLRESKPSRAPLSKAQFSFERAARSAPNPPPQVRPRDQVLPARRGNCLPPVRGLNKDTAPRSVKKQSRPAPRR